MMDKKSKKIKVRALPAFTGRRFVTLEGLNSKDFRKLKAGEAVLIDEKYFNDLLYEEIKDGDS